MREHEVPTHVQAEDKVLLWFTFPQIVAVVAVCAVAYGAYHYLPFGPMAVRLALGVLIGIVGIALTVGKVGGRGLPLVAADLLKFNLGARRYAGSPLEMTQERAARAGTGGQARPPAAAWPKSGIRWCSTGGESGAASKGRAPFRPHSWFGKRRNRNGGENRPNTQAEGGRGKKPWRPLPGGGGGRAAGRGPAAQRRPWPTTPTTRTRAGGWTRSTSCRRTRCRDGASTWSGWPSPATPPP